MAGPKAWPPVVATLAAMTILGLVAIAASAGAAIAAASSDGLAAPRPGVAVMHADAPFLTATATPTVTPTTAPCVSNYRATAGTGATLVPGSALIPGSQCDDCAAAFTLPFSYTLYERSFGTASVTSNGQLVFATPVDPSFTNYCYPDVNTSYSIAGHWSDLTTDITVLNCDTCGIFTSVSGSAPNRVLNVEWRALMFDTGNPVNFEIRLFEGQTRFDIIYATVDASAGGTRNSTVAVQQGTGQTLYNYQCPGQSQNIGNGTILTWQLLLICPSPTPTLTPTLTPTFTATSSATATATPSATPTTTLTQTVTPTDTATSTPTVTVTPTGTSQPAFTPTGTATPTAALVVVVGSVSLTGRGLAPNGRWAIPVTVSLAQAGGSIQLDYNTVTDNYGFLTLTTTLPPGQYDWRIKSPNMLANGGTAQLAAGSNDIAMGLLRPGDANNDNCVRVTDFNIVKLTYAKSLGDPGYDARADFNGDNTISVLDFNLLKVYYSLCGAPPIIVPTPTPSSTATATPTAPPLLVGHVVILGRTAPPSPRQSVPITLTLRSLTTGTGFEFSATTDASGNFTVTAPAPDTYGYRVKNPQTLANAGSVTLGAGTTSADMGQLREGDANNDNCVRVIDFNIVKLTYAKSLGDPGYDARADFNGDNTISVLDFNLLKVNYSMCGADPITPGAP